MKSWESVLNYQNATELPVLANVDVLVVGAGAAGVAAATISAEAGLDTLVVESYGFTGGAAVAGLSGTICGLFAGMEEPEKNEPHQLVHGFAERFRKKLEDNKGVTSPQVYGKTHSVTHDPLVWREAGDALLSQSGARILFHTDVISVIVEENTFYGAVVSSKAGQSLIRAKRIIDASGDAAMIKRGGFRTVMGDAGVVQNPTMIFRIGGVDTEKFTEFWGDNMISTSYITDLLKKAEEEYGYDLPRKKIWLYPTTRPNEIMVNGTRISGPNKRPLNPIDPEDHTIAEINGREQVREYARFLANFIPGCEKSFVVDTGVEAGIRQTRSIRGVTTLTNEDVVQTRKPTDGIVRSAWPIELHSDSKSKLHWIIDDFYEIPYGTLVPEVAENIIVAGRCLSAEHEALASARVTAQCFELGQAAAIATNLSLKNDLPYRKIAGEEIRELMKDYGSTI